MSKAKRRELKTEREREKDVSGIARKSVEISVDSGSLSESTARDAAVIGQMLNDFPFDGNINQYFANGMGVLLIDLPKTDALPVLGKLLSEAMSEKEADGAMKNLNKSRLLVFRFKV